MSTNFQGFEEIKSDDLPVSKTEKIAEISSNIADTKEWSNQSILKITCVSFSLFVVAVIVGALVSGSLSLLGDAVAMTVDVFTYLSNMYAERVKARSVDGVLTENTRILLEIVIPSFSIAALMGITLYIMLEAIATLEAGGGDNVNVYFLYGYASANTLVDIVSAGMFFMKGKKVFHHPVELKGVEEVEEGQEEGRVSTKSDLSMGRKNLNMISAFTHVGGDTLRTVSVFIAAVVATVTDISSDTCDSWAAIIVSGTIVAVVIPLMREIYKSARELLF